MIKSIYIHIPFCSQICSYCNFPKMYYYEDLTSKYLDSLKLEIESAYQHEVISTLYVGGGTPSALSISNLKKLFNILEIIKLADDYEYTFEINVEDISVEKLKLLKKAGINRISIGVQTFNQKYLKFLNRSILSINDKILLAKKYFTNINIDIIYGLPNETIEELDQDLTEVLKLNVPHLSFYSLIIEKHTKLYINNIKNIDEDLDNKMFYYIKTILEKNGYSHYEISNYAKEEYQSKHNLTYWNNQYYYGFGLGASGYINKKRYINTININRYIKGYFDQTEEILTNKDIISYELILGLRKLEGVNLLDFKAKYKKDLRTIFYIEDLIEQQILLIKNNFLFINKDYLYISNEILERFI